MIINYEHYVDGSGTAHIANNQVTFAKLQDISHSRTLVGRAVGSAGGDAAVYGIIKIDGRKRSYC